MEIRKVKEQLRQGKSLYDLPLRVTFYARVSTDMDVQLNSLENQVQYYTELIGSKPAWTFLPGYVDEGLSGGTTKKRDAFNRMIADAKAGLFDLIITKEISRFSRSTLDSIQYTQTLRDYDVGVLFETNGINTLEGDSELLLTIMSAMAQDEIRKLSERLKFGYRQAIRNGHVLGNDKLYGYDKRDCVLTINEAEAEIVRIVFDLYANQGLGTRKISQKLWEMGYRSRQGNAFNTLTIRHMIENPKYKGWYCGHKTQSLNYRTKETAFLDESEWVMYPDSSIPAIVPEELWDRANALYKSRRQQMMTHAKGASYHNRYPYSGKIICEVHGAPYHRRMLERKDGAQEAWYCREYRSKGVAGCTAPRIGSGELDQVMARVFAEVVQDREAIVGTILDILRDIPKGVDYDKIRQRLEGEMQQLRNKKERLLDLSLDGAISNAEFRIRNEDMNAQLQRLEGELTQLQAQERADAEAVMNLEEIRKALLRTLSFTDGIHSGLVASILEKVVVKKESTRQELHLDIFLKLGEQFRGVYTTKTGDVSITSSKSITPPNRTRRI